MKSLSTTKEIRRNRFICCVDAKRCANPWKKMQENLIHWSDLFAGGLFRNNVPRRHVRKDQRENEKRSKVELVAWIEQHQPVTRGNLLRAFEDMDYEQLQGWLSELQRERRLFEVNPETYYTTIEE
jgi:hypothetical protein